MRFSFLGTVIDCDLLQGRYPLPPQSFPENAGPYGSSFAGTSVGSASHVTHPVLAEAEGSIRGLVSRMPPRNGDSGLCISPGPLEGPLLAKARHNPRHAAQKEVCHDRCFQQGMGSAMRGQTDLRPVVRRGVRPAHQLPRNAISMSGLSILPAGHSETPCANTLRQQVRGVIHKLPELPCLEVTLYAGEWPSCVGSEQYALTEGDACALKRKAGPCFPPSRSAAAGTQASQGTTAQADSNTLPPSEEPTVGVWVIPAAENSPMADPLETSSLKRMARNSIYGPACVAARREPFVLPECVLNTMAEARAPSTRRLYALK